MRYYKVRPIEKVTQQEIGTFEFQDKYFILHQGDSAWHLTGLKYDNQKLSGDLSILPGNHWKYLSTSPEGGNRYRRNNTVDESDLLTEVHLYLADTVIPAFTVGDQIRIAYSAISKAEAFVKAKGRSTVSWVVPAVVTPILILGGVVGIIAATKSSCPLVYVKNGNNYDFAGEVFGGAVDPSQERHDYLPLPGFKPLQNYYSLVISNGLPEIQYINLAELWIVNHPGNVMVLPDRQGVVHSYSDPRLPVEAQSSAHADLLSRIVKKDQLCFLFDEEPSKTGDANAFNEVFLSFIIPDRTDNAKLIISAGNSMWGDYTYGEFTKLFGTDYGAWIKKQGKEQAERNRRWKLDQRFAMMVYLETKAGWQFVDYFDLIGPLGARDLIMPVDLSNALTTTSPDQGRTLRIKLESGFKFWDLDYTAMDFTRDTVFKIEHVQPVSAVTESGKDVTAATAKNDTLYYIQETTGEQGLMVCRDSPEIKNMKKSVFLHTKGYYIHVRNYHNPPDYKQIQTFLVPGRFSKFSYENHVEFIKNNWVFVPDPKLQ
jgi:hypothetical protein